MPTAFSAFNLFPSPRLLEVIDEIPTPIDWARASIKRISFCDRREGVNNKVIV
ncbi:hypothetical protein [Clostridium estertheticum]|uniref:hypothetical protein n=1 Tax=Clostridium estertheticum TaxID=238834 RepID=UPI00209B87A2|nr:hypothetical protein [Clostridium estertheticum]